MIEILGHIVKMYSTAIMLLNQFKPYDDML